VAVSGRPDRHGMARPAQQPRLARSAAASWARGPPAAAVPRAAAERYMEAAAVRRRGPGRPLAAARGRPAADRWVVAASVPGWPAAEGRRIPHWAPAREVVVAPRSNQVVSPERPPALPRRRPAAAATPRAAAELERAPARRRPAPLRAPAPGPRSEAAAPRLVAPRCPAAAARPRRTAPPQRPSAVPLPRPRAATARRRPVGPVPPGWQSAASLCRPTTRARRAIAVDREALPYRPQSSPESSGHARICQPCKGRKPPSSPDQASGFWSSRNSW
jgi:hypothetical protein